MKNKDVTDDTPSSHNLIYLAHMKIIKTYNMAVVLQVEAETDDKISMRFNMLDLIEAHNLA